MRILEYQAEMGNYCITSVTVPPKANG